MNRQPMISIAICTYNGGAYLASQLKSILTQTRPVDEVILCDDGSSDDTVEAVSYTHLEVYKRQPYTRCSLSLICSTLP